MCCVRNLLITGMLPSTQFTSLGYVLRPEHNFHSPELKLEFTSLGYVLRPELILVVPSEELEFTSLGYV